MAELGHIERTRNAEQIDGKEVVIGAETVVVKSTDADGNVTECSGLTVPTDDTAGYAKECRFIKSDAADGAAGEYRNIGTALACEFALDANVPADGDAVENNLAKFDANGNPVDSGTSLAALVAALAKVAQFTKKVVFAEEKTTAGGNAVEAIACSGIVATTDKVTVCLKDDGTNNVTIKGYAVTNDTVTVTFSGDPGADTVVVVTAIRPVT
jgi:hypothetical protein